MITCFVFFIAVLPEMSHQTGNQTLKLDMSQDVVSSLEEQRARRLRVAARNHRQQAETASASQQYQLERYKATVSHQSRHHLVAYNRLKLISLERDCHVTAPTSTLVEEAREGTSSNLDLKPPKENESETMLCRLKDRSQSAALGRDCNRREMIDSNAI